MCHLQPLAYNLIGSLLHVLHKGNFLQSKFFKEDKYNSSTLNCDSERYLQDSICLVRTQGLLPIKLLEFTSIFSATKSTIDFHTGLIVSFFIEQERGEGERERERERAHKQKNCSLAMKMFKGLVTHYYTYIIMTLLYQFIIRRIRKVLE